MDQRTLAVALLLASGCSLTTKTDDLEPLVDAEGFCAAYFTAAVDFFEACQGAHPAYGEVLFAQQSPECAAWGRAQDAGRLAYDRPSAQACIAGIQGGGCNVTEAILAPCDQAIRGVVGPGGACGSGLECVDETTWGCKFTGSTCPGTCTPRAALNEACADVGCQVGLACSIPGTGLCVAAPTATQACVGFSCAEGHYCDATNVCRPRGRSGAACTSNFECDTRFFCDTVRATPTCQPEPETALQTTVGARCDGPFECVYGLYCDRSALPYTCKAQALNADCTATSSVCKAPQICPSGAGTVTCQNPKTAGQACLGGADECQPGLTCDATNGVMGTCALPARIGDTCVTGGELRICGSGWCDRFGTLECAPYLALGATCAFSSQCSQGGVDVICRDDGAGPMCVASCQ